MKNTTNLTNQEKQSIRALNFTATFDGIIIDENDIKYMLQRGIEKFVAKSRRHLVSITETAYPIRIKWTSSLGSDKDSEISKLHSESQVDLNDQSVKKEYQALSGEC